MRECRFAIQRYQVIEGLRERRKSLVIISQCCVNISQRSSWCILIVDYGGGAIQRSYCKHAIQQKFMAESILRDNNLPCIIARGIIAEFS